MNTLDYNQLLLISLWQYNHHVEEGLGLELFKETFGEADGGHYYEKWNGYFNRNLWDMIAYFKCEKETGRNSATWSAGKSSCTNKTVSDMKHDNNDFYNMEKLQSFAAFTIPGTG